MMGKMTKAVKKVGDRIIHSEFVPEIPHKYLIQQGWVIQDIPESIIELKEGISKITVPDDLETPAKIEDVREVKYKVDNLISDPNIKPKRPRRTNAQILADQNKK